MEGQVKSFGDVELNDFGSGRERMRSIKLKDGRTFLVRPFKGKQGFKLQASLMKYASNAFGGLLAGALDTIDGDGAIEKMDALNFAMSGILQGGFNDVNDAGFLDFIYELFTCTNIDNKAVDFDEEFMGDTGTPIILAVHIITFNFSSVFQQLGIGALFKKKEAEESQIRG